MSYALRAHLHMFWRDDETPASEPLTYVEAAPPAHSRSMWRSTASALLPPRLL